MGKKAAKNDGVIKFQANVTQVKTMVDGGIRIQLDLAETETDTAWSMMECQRNGYTLDIVALPVAPIIQGVENGET